MKPFLNLKSVDYIIAEINKAQPLFAELVPLEEACGRIMAETFYAPFDLPGFSRSTVDGYAVQGRSVFGASESSPALLRCIGECIMGEEPQFELNEGETARILTGAMLPKGADCVVMLEYARPAGADLVELARSQAPGDNIVGPADDAARGEALIQAGTRLRPQEIGCLASFGLSETRVYRKPDVTIISTGDEVLPINQTPAKGQIRDVNSYSLSAFCRSQGATVRRLGIVGDNKPELAQKIASALSGSDIVILSGGSSAGARDFTLDVFMDQPESRLICHGAALSPGKPFILAQSGKKYLIGMPGHVAGALICAQVFVKPLLKRLQGAAPALFSKQIKAKLGRSIASAQGRRDFIRCKLETDRDGTLIATPLTGPSALLSSLLKADCVAICPENREGLAKGEEIFVEPI